MKQHQKSFWQVWGFGLAVVALFAVMSQSKSETVPIDGLVASQEIEAPIIRAVTVGLAGPVLAQSVNHITQNTIISSSSVNHITSNTVISSSSVNHITSNTVISSSSVNHITANTVISSSSVQHITSNTIITSPIERLSSVFLPTSATLPVPQIQSSLLESRRG